APPRPLEPRAVSRQLCRGVSSLYCGYSRLAHNIYYGKLWASVQSDADLGSALRLWYLDRQPVVAGLDAVRQFCTQFAIIEALVHVGQNCPAWPDPLNPRQRFRQVAMRRMRFAPHAVDNPNLDPGERGKRILVESGYIGRIRDRPDTKTKAH